MSTPKSTRAGRPSTRAPRGVVATPHFLASSAGFNAMQRGGGAVDAAIAANAGCAHMAGLGGDGIWLIAEADGKVHGIDASGPAARLATLDTYRARSENGEVPVRGPLSALTIPGAVDGWRLAHERFGRLAWDELFDAAILYAREGVPVTRSLATWLALDEQILRGCSETALIDKSYAETRRG
jgi:gamma-glutamyltranspeptidase